MLSKLLLLQFQVCTEGYSEPCRSSKMELFARIVNGFQLLTIFLQKTPSYIINTVFNTTLIHTGTGCNFINAY